MCIDTKPHINLSPIERFFAIVAGDAESGGFIDLTEGEVYTGAYCSCGQHFIVDKDDSGDTDVAYDKQRFTDVPDISEIIHSLESQTEYA